MSIDGEEKTHIHTKEEYVENQFKKRNEKEGVLGIGNSYQSFLLYLIQGDNCQFCCSPCGTSVYLCFTFVFPDYDSSVNCYGQQALLSSDNSCFHIHVHI